MRSSPRSGSPLRVGAIVGVGREPVPDRGHARGGLGWHLARLALPVPDQSEVWARPHQRRHVLSVHRVGENGSALVLLGKLAGGGPCDVVSECEQELRLIGDDIPDHVIHHSQRAGTLGERAGVRVRGQCGCEPVLADALGREPPGGRQRRVAAPRSRQDPVLVARCGRQAIHLPPHETARYDVHGWPHRTPDVGPGSFDFHAGRRG